MGHLSRLHVTVSMKAGQPLVVKSAPGRGNPDAVRGERVRAEPRGGGRHTPFFSGYRPQFFFRTTDVTGAVTLPAGVEMCLPGDHASVSVELPEATPVAVDEGQRFAIREGGRTVGSGVVTKVP